MEYVLICVLNDTLVRAAAEHPCAVLDTHPVTRRAARSGLNPPGHEVTAKACQIMKAETQS